MKENLFGKSLRELRKSMKLTQNEFAQKIGYSRRNLCNWEVGRSEPPLNAIYKIVETFDVSLDELFGVYK